MGASGLEARVVWNPPCLGLCDLLGDLAGTERLSLSWLRDVEEVDREGGGLFALLSRENRDFILASLRILRKDVT